MGINNKLKQLVDYLDISQRKFTTNCGLSEGALRGGKSVSVEGLVKIKQTYPILNLQWLLFDQGNMILSADEVNEDGVQYKSGKAIDDIVDEKINLAKQELKEVLGEMLSSMIEEEIAKTKKELTGG